MNRRGISYARVQPQRCRSLPASAPWVKLKFKIVQNIKVQTHSRRYKFEIIDFDTKIIGAVTMTAGGVSMACLPLVVPPSYCPHVFNFVICTKQFERFDVKLIGSISQRYICYLNEVAGATHCDVVDPALPWRQFLVPEPPGADVRAGLLRRVRVLHLRRPCRRVHGHGDGFVGLLRVWGRGLALPADVRGLLRVARIICWRNSGLFFVKQKLIDFAAFVINFYCQTFTQR